MYIKNFEKYNVFGYPIITLNEMVIRVMLIYFMNVKKCFYSECNGHSKMIILRMQWAFKKCLYSECDGHSKTDSTLNVMDIQKMIILQMRWTFKMILLKM